MSIPDDCARERRLALKALFTPYYLIPHEIIPKPAIAWPEELIDMVERLTLQVKTSPKSPNQEYIDVYPLLDGSRIKSEWQTEKWQLNIRYWGEFDNDRIRLFHDGDNSTGKRKDTYRKSAEKAIQFFPALRAPQGSVYPEYIGSIPRYGPITIEDLAENLLPGIGMHMLARWMFFEMLRLKKEIKSAQ